MESNTVSFVTAFTAGLLTFLSPCILPLIPAYISYITGISFDDLKDGDKASVRKKAVLHSLLFVCGFSLVFITLGASATFLGQKLIQHQMIISKVGGVFVIIFGLYLMGIFKFAFMGKEKRLQFKLRKGTKIGSVLFGITFAAAWTPCVGPILGSILVLAGTKSSLLEGVGMLSVYSLGIAIPFIVSAVLINSFLALFAKFKKYLFIVRFACGVLLIIVGLVLLLKGYMV